MTEQKAIARLEHHIEWGFSEPTKEALEMAIKALEKQIPKKVVFCRNLMTKEANTICPACKRIVESTNFHCWYCGQKLDWSEQNERT